MLWKCKSIYHNHQQMKQLILIIQHNGRLVWMPFDMHHPPKHCWWAGTKDWPKEPNVWILPSRLLKSQSDQASVGMCLCRNKSDLWKPHPTGPKGSTANIPTSDTAGHPRSLLSISWWLRPVLAAQEELAEYKAGGFHVAAVRCMTPLWPKPLPVVWERVPTVQATETPL